MGFKIIESKVHVEDAEACCHGLQNEIVSICDTEDDLTALGNDWYPMSVAIILDPFSVKLMSASREWKDKPGGGGSTQKELPAYTLADALKKLSVNSTGDGLEWQEDNNPIPPFTTEDAGKVPKVNATGTEVEWQSAGGDQHLYRHILKIKMVQDGMYPTSHEMNMDLFNADPTPIDSTQKLKTFASNGYRITNGSTTSGFYYITLQIENSSITLKWYNGSTVTTTMFGYASNTFTFTDTVTQIL